MPATSVRISGPSERAFDEEELKKLHGEAAPVAPVPDAPPPPTPEPAPVIAPLLPDEPIIAPKDWTPEIEAARSKADELRPYALLARTADRVNAAFAGRAPDDWAARGIEQTAALPAARVTEDMRRESADLERKKAQEAADPSSPANQKFRLMVKSQFGPFAEALGPNFDKLTRTQLETALGMRATATNERLEKDKLAYDRWKNERDTAFEREKFEDQKRHEKAMESIGWTNANKESSSIANQDRYDHRQAVGKLWDASKNLEKLAPALETWSRIEALAPGLSKAQVPEGYMLNDWERVKLDVLRGLGGPRYAKGGKEELMLRQAIQQVRNEIQRDLFGATVTPSEQEQFNKAFDDAIASGPDAMSAALTLFRRRLGAKLGVHTGTVQFLFPDQADGYLNAIGVGKYMPLFGDVIQPVTAPMRPPTPGARAGGEAGTPPSAPPNKAQSTPADAVTVKVKATGKQKTVPRANAEKYRNDPRFEVSQ